MACSLSIASFHARSKRPALTLRAFSIRALRFSNPAPSSSSDSVPGRRPICVFKSSMIPYCANSDPSCAARLPQMVSIRSRILPSSTVGPGPSTAPAARPNWLNSGLTPISNPGPRIGGSVKVRSQPRKAFSSPNTSTALTFNCANVAAKRSSTVE